MALFRMFTCARLTSNKLADDLLKFAAARRSGRKDIHVVFDVYYKNSIKNAETRNRSTSELRFKTIVGSSQTGQWGVFLSNRNNKVALIRFLCQDGKENVWHWRRKIICCFCWAMLLHKGWWSCELIEDLDCNQEVADTRMMLHAQHLWHSSENYSCMKLMFLLSRSPYLLKFQVTCVFVLAL